MKQYTVQKKVVQTYLVMGTSQDDAEDKVARGSSGILVRTRESVDLIDPCDGACCSDCVNGRPNGVCELDLCTHDEVCTSFAGMVEGEGKTCACGWWTCGSRGCGMCPDCEGEYCECGV